MSSAALQDPMSRPATKRQGVIITAEQHDKLNELAAATGTSKNSLIRSAIARLLADMEDAA